MTLPVLDLMPGDAPFRTDPKQSYTLPARFYHDRDIWEAEKATIFYRSWYYAGHASQVAEAGQYLTVRIHEQNVFVARSRSGELNAFHNVCPHRGHELVSGTGRKNVITCPYHAWAFDFDGVLRSARNTENVSGFRKEEFSLKPVRVEVFCGLVLVNLDPDAAPFAEQMGDLEQEIRRYVPSVDDLQFAQRDTYDVAANWKVLVDNFLECYHCAPAHKDFVDLVDMNSYRTITCGLYSSQCAGQPRSLNAKAYSFQPGDVDFGYAGWFVWPNFTIWAYPGEANLSVLQMNPDAPERCVEFQDWFVKDGKVTTQLRDAINYQIDVLQPEDIGLCESVQKGLKSSGYNQGRFVVDEGLTELSEHAVHHFQKLVANALGARLDPDMQACPSTGLG
ncbi:MAG: aromatic ring-hydroxylating dioxygenase subunit alpha [Pseudomonadota bacterium]